MSAELDTTTGEAACLTVGQTAWHEAGVNVPAGTVLSMEEAIKLAKLDWTVSARRVATEVTNPDGDTYWMADPRYQAIQRDDTKGVLGVVGKYYTPVQNRDAFKVFQPLLGEGLATIETAGALREGRDVWVAVRFDRSRLTEAAQETFTAEGIEPFGVLLNNHAGQRRAILGRTDVRVVCANTAALFLSQMDKSNGVAVRHTTTAEAKLASGAMTLWAGLLKHYDAAAKAYRLLRATYLDEALFRKLVLDVVAKEPKPRAGMQVVLPEDAGERALRALARRDVVTRLWTGGIGHTGDHSALEAWNGVTQALDHDSLFAPPRAQRVAALTDGNLASMKATVWANLTGYAAAQAAATPEGM